MVNHATLVTVREAATRLYVSTDTIRRLIAAGEIQAFRVGRQFRIPAPELERYDRPVNEVEFPPLRQQIAMAGAAARWRAPDVAAEEELDAHITRIVHEAPAMTPEQIERLADLLQGAVLPVDGGAV